MNMKDTDRLLQRLVPAENRGCEAASAPLVNSPIPADEQDRSPEAVEYQRAIEASVADLEAAASEHELRETVYRFTGATLKSWVHRFAAAFLRRRISKLRRSATGGNAKLCERGEGA